VDSLCCGGSLANMKISNKTKNKMAVDAAAKLTVGNPDILATSCPLCKKTFSSATKTRVADISEIVAEAIKYPPVKKNSKQIGTIKKLADIPRKNSPLLKHV
jgi:Fe-S oxidoreductase